MGPPVRTHAFLFLLDGSEVGIAIQVAQNLSVLQCSSLAVGNVGEIQCPLSGRFVTVLAACGAGDELARLWFEQTTGRGIIPQILEPEPVPEKECDVHVA